MLLNSKYRYIWLDFETTGLDATKDEPIQIGVIEIDHTGKIIGEYQSLIKPDKKTDELKHIVGFITGLSISELEMAPSRKTVEQEVSKFFWENTIIIWHNIKFDLDFLNKYFPSLKYLDSINTFPLAQTIVHYAQSYALEVLIENLKSEKMFSVIFENDDHGEEKSHDAFFDAKNSIKLFIYFVKYLHSLIEAYPNLVHIIHKTTGIWNQIIELTKYKNIPAIEVNFPALERISPSHTTVVKSIAGIDTDTLENQKKYYIGNIAIKNLLAALAENKNIILAFQNIQKLDIAKSVLNDMGIKNIGFTKEDQTINQENFKKFLNKGQFSTEECLFIIKYISHLKRGLGILNLNNQVDYKIYHYIKDTRAKTKFPIVLTTHHGLFTSLAENEEAYQDYDICFFDTEQWFKTYNFFISSPIDLYYTLNILESFVYQQKVDNQIKGIPVNDIPGELEEFVNMFQICIWVLFTESKKLFIRVEDTMVQHNPIWEHGDFHQTNQLRKQLLDKKEGLEKVLSKDNYKLLDKHMTHIKKVFNGIINIFKKMYGSSDFYFTYSESQKYTDWKEFVDIFKNKVVFFSNTGTQFTPLISSSQVPNTSPAPPPAVGSQIILNIPKMEALMEHIKTQEENDKEYSCFIFSPKKNESKKIFEDLCQNNIHKQALLLVENITGGIGKNIFKAKQSKNKILIWWYNFILYLYANKIPLKEIILFNSRGPSEQNILDDIKRYNIMEDTRKKS